MSEIFLQLSITLGIAVVLSFVVKILRQPLIIAYIITGIIVGPAISGFVSDVNALESLSHIGIALLLFIVGLGLQPKVIKEVGKVALLTGVAQIVFTTVVGYIFSRFVGISPLIALYLSFAFSLSSTIIILQLLYHKKEQYTLYGRITIGFLLVQDIIAIISFIVISSASTVGTGNFLPMILWLLLKLGLIGLSLFILTKYVTPRIDKHFASNKEMLFTFSLGICFILATIFYKLHLSFELGALVAGIILSLSPYQREIAHRLASIRDFFLIIFFITLGSHINWSNISDYRSVIIFFVFFILIGNPIILMCFMKLMNYTSKTSFMVSLTVAQISEFSLILLGAGISYGHLPANILSPATFIGLITITISSYYISYNEQIYHRLKKYIHFIFPDKKAIKGKTLVEKFDVILFGCHIMGSGLISEMKKRKARFIVIDHDPAVIRSLQKNKINCLYGSADNIDLLDELQLNSAKLIISTIPQFEINMFLASYLKKIRKHNNFICVTDHFQDAEKLYKEGTAYVIMPQYLGRRFISEMFKKYKLNNKKYGLEKKKHLFDFKYLDFGGKI